MRELFEAIDNCEAGSVNMVLTALDGEYLGEKALVSDGKLIWESNEEGFFSKYEEAVWSDAGQRRGYNRRQPGVL